MADSVLRVRIDGTCLDVKIASDMLGHDTTLQSDADVIGCMLADLSLMEDSDLLLNAVREVATTRQPRTVESVYSSGDAEYNLEARIVACAADEALIIIRNVTERHQVEEILRQQANLVENANDVIIYTDLDFRLLSWNRAAERIYGHRLEDVQGQFFYEVVNIRYPDDDRDRQVAIFNQNGHWRGEQVHHRKDGTPIDVLASVALVKDSRGNPIGVVGINRDITEQKQTETLMMLAQKYESLSLLAGGIAHDFNNLLTGILSQAALAQRKLPSQSDASAHLLKAIKSTERAADLTRQLLAYTGQGAFVIEAVDLNRLIQDNLGLLEAVLSKRTRLELRLARNLPTIKIDRGQIQQITMNLVINAAESITHDHGYILIETAVVQVTAQMSELYISSAQMTPGPYVALKVADNGSGMDASTLERIFDPYFTTKELGSGLGLSATLGIVNRYHGGIRVESGYRIPALHEQKQRAPEWSSGTTFTLLFPASQHPDVLDDAPVDVPKFVPIEGTILVADDEAPIREAVQDILKAVHTRVITASNGSEALAQFTAHRQEIALVLLDLQMPEMNGADALRAIRAVAPDVKVILSSGYSESESTKNVLHDESTFFLQKPYAPEKLLRFIHRALGTHAAANGKEELRQPPGAISTPPQRPANTSANRRRR